MRHPEIIATRAVININLFISARRRQLFATSVPPLDEYISDKFSHLIAHQLINVNNILS